MKLIGKIRGRARRAARDGAALAASLLDALTTETRLRSAAKAITWRAMAALVTLSLIIAAGGSTEVAVGVASLDSLIKLILYYCHERAWCPPPDSPAQSAPNTRSAPACGSTARSATLSTARYVCGRKADETESAVHSVPGVCGVHDMPS